MATHDKKCAKCGKDFKARTKRAMFCSDQCRWDAHNAAKKDLTEYEDIPKDYDAVKRGVSGRGARAKGARGEREVCHLIAGITGDDVSRNIAQSRDGGHDVDWGPFAIEVKTTQTVSMPAWQAQVRKSVEGTGKVPSVCWRRKGEEWWVALPMEAFVEIFNTLRRAAEAGLKQNE